MAVIDYYDYLESGFKIFPLYNIISGGLCECGDENCCAVGKHPRFANWQLGIHWTEEQLDFMQDIGQFDTGYGVLCDGYLIVDVDPRNGGTESLKQLEIDLNINLAELSGFVVKTGGNGLHIYFKRDKEKQLVTGIKQYKGIDFKTSGFVVGCGSTHKSTLEYEAIKGSPSNISDAPVELVKILERKQYSAQFKLDKDKAEPELINELLSYLPASCCDDYENWVSIGMAIHDATDGAGFELWDAWSKQSAKYNPDVMDIKWHSFGKSNQPVTIGTLKKLAADNGWVEPVTFYEDVDIEDKAVSPIQTFDLLDTSWVNLKKPMGLVGDISAHIISSARYKRENLAVGAALQIVSNCCGMQYGLNTTPKTGGRLAGINLYTFGVAATGTGKDHIVNSIERYMSVVGGIPGVYKKIKSAQEITRNAVNGRLNCYVIDELGLKLASWTNSKNASYQTEIIEVLLEGYSKAFGTWAIDGDTRKTIIEESKKVIAALNKKKEEGIDEFSAEDEERKLYHKELIHDLITSGLKNRFFSIFGVTTPETFDHIMTRQQVESGFIGRSIVLEDKSTIEKENYEAAPLEIPDRVKTKLMQVALGGCSDTLYSHAVGTTQWKHEPIEITWGENAFESYKQVGDYFYQWKIKESERADGGLEGLLSRGAFACAKVAATLALGDGKIIEVRHVQWAFELIKRDAEKKLELVRADVASKVNNASGELIAKLKSKMDTEKGFTAAFLRNRLPKFTSDNVEQALEWLKGQGEIEEREEVSGNGKKTIKYYLVEQ